MVMAFCLLFAGCGNEKADTPDTADNVNTQQTDESGRIKIGVAVYSLDDPEVRAFRNYYENYISENFEADFLYSTEILSAEDEKSFINNAIKNGVKGIISFVSYDLEATMKTCSSSKIYYMMGSGSIPDEAFEKAKTNPYFLGVVGPSDEMEKEAGSNMASYFINNKLEDQANAPTGYIILSGGAKASNVMHANRTAAMLETLGLPADKATVSETTILDSNYGKVCIIPGYAREEATIPSLKEQLATGEYSVVLSSYTIADLWKTIKEAQSNTDFTIRTGTVDCFTEENLSAVQDNVLHYVVGKYSSLLGPSFAAMYNAVTGHADDFRSEDGTAFSISQGFWTATNKEEYQKLYGLTSGIYVNAYNADDLTKVIKEYNPNATMEDLVKLAGAYSVEDVKARRGQK